MREYRRLQKRIFRSNFHEFSFPRMDSLRFWNVLDSKMVFMNRFWHNLTLLMFHKAQKLTSKFSKFRFCKRMHPFAPHYAKLMKHTDSPVAQVFGPLRTSSAVATSMQRICCTHLFFQFPFFATTFSGSTLSIPEKRCYGLSREYTKVSKGGRIVWESGGVGKKA